MRFLRLSFLLLVSSLVLAACTNPLESKAKAGLQVMTNDVSASLFLDGQYLDKSPYISKEIRPGTYSLRIQPDDPTLASYETTITLEKGLLGVVVWKPGTRPELSGGVIFEMSKLADRKQTELVVASIPDAAIVSIDERAKEFAPIVLTDLSPGQHELTISLPSYEALKHTVNLVEGHRVTVTVKLAKSSLDVVTPATASGAAATTSASTIATASARTSISTSSANLNPTTQTATTGAQVAGPKVKIKPTGYKVNNQEVLRVRDKPSSAGQEIGVVPINSLYPYTGQTMDGWLEIEFNNTTGWVSSQYADIIR